MGDCRRDWLDHVLALNERNLKRLMKDYIRYYHEDRTLDVAVDWSRLLRGHGWACGSLEGHHGGGDRINLSLRECREGGHASRGDAQANDTARGLHLGGAGIVHVNDAWAEPPPCPSGPWQAAQ